jgi:hypothetical protein
MAPEWVDYLGAFSAAVAAVLALGALYFAVKAGRDLVHDRRDTFEIGILREMLSYLDEGLGLYWPQFSTSKFSTLYDLVGENLPAVDELLGKQANLDISEVLIQPSPVRTQMILENQRRERRRNELLDNARSDIHAAINARVGRPRRAGALRARLNRR